MGKSKILCLLDLLERRTDGDRGLTMPQIIEGLEAQGISAERKALYRDIAALRQAGFDIRKLPARPVQYALVRSDLGLDDVMMLVDAVQSSRFLTERKSAQLVRSLKTLVSDRQRKLLEKRVHVRGRVKSQSESVFHSVDTIHEAIQRRRKVEFLYFSYGTDLKRHPRHEGKRYAVSPVRVVFSDGNYYLAAYEAAAGDAEGTVKTYRIDRMELLQVSEAKADRAAAEAAYEGEDFAYVSFGMFAGRHASVTLRVQAPLMDALVDVFGPGIEVLKAAQDWAEVRVPVQVSPQFFGWVAGLDGHVSIKAPKAVRESYRDWLRSLADGC